MFSSFIGSGIYFLDFFPLSIGHAVTVVFCDLGICKCESETVSVSFSFFGGFLGARLTEGCETLHTRPPYVSVYVLLVCALRGPHFIVFCGFGASKCKNGGGSVRMGDFLVFWGFFRVLRLGEVTLLLSQHWYLLICLF